jgi:hypothetical protein
MDRLHEILSKRVKDDLVYVIWSRKHRVTVVSGVKVGGRGNYQYNYLTVSKRFIPGIYSWYVTKNNSKMRELAKFEPLTSKYLQFDGTSIEALEHDPSALQYKQQKYYDDLLESVKNEDLVNQWLLRQGNQHGKLLYMNLMFLVRSQINPQLASASNSKFSKKTRNTIIENWYKSRKQKTVKVGSERVQLIMDCVGLFTSDTKSVSILPNCDCIDSFDVEHIVSNSFGVDNEDTQNGVLLDHVVNRKKGNTMLFLCSDDVRDYIIQKKEKQKQYLKQFDPWYRRLF